MSRPLDTQSRTDDIARSIARLIAAGGLGAVTMRAIAGTTGISLGTLCGHLDNRQRILRVCGHSHARQHHDDLAHRVGRDGLAGFLPADGSEVMAARVWLAWRELARDDVNLARTVGESDATERNLLRAVTGADEVLLDALLAAILGLRDLVCRRGDEALPFDRAQRALVAWADAAEVAEVADVARARRSATMASGSSAE